MSDMNINVFDMFNKAVDSYNTTITDPARQLSFDKMTYHEKKGIFYNSLRREFGYTCQFSASNVLRMDDFEIKLDERHRIISFEITKKFYGYSNWEDEKKDRALFITNELRKVDKALPTIYPTFELNEMSRIVNSIN